MNSTDSGETRFLHAEASWGRIWNKAFALFAMALCWLGGAVQGQELVVEQAEVDYLESVQGDGGLSLEGFAGPLIVTTVDESAAVLSGSSGTAALSLISGRVVTLASSPNIDGRPRLQIALDRQDVILTIPSGGTGYILETTTDLADAFSWQPLMRLSEGTNYRARVVDRLRFYRLRTP